MRFHDRMLRERLLLARAAFLSGPRQVGKTTSARELSDLYLDWNDVEDRRVILRGPQAIAAHLELAAEPTSSQSTTLIIDNLHGHRDWKGLLRKVNSSRLPHLHLVVTALGLPDKPTPNLLQMRIHPWSVAECAHDEDPTDAIRPATNIKESDWHALLAHGGFPEPFRRRDPKFTQRWNERRKADLIEHDLPKFASVRDPAIVQMLALLLAERSATSLIYSDLARELGVTVDTVRRWIDLLESLQYGFRVRPWSAKVPKALRKEPRWFLRDWSSVTTPQARNRTFIACHLLKAVHGWTDMGLGRFELRYIRDKLKREVDFLVVRERQPWFLVRVANEMGLGSRAEAAPVLQHFQHCTGAPHAFEVVLDEPFAAVDCFQAHQPVVVPARTLLSQLW